MDALSGFPFGSAMFRQRGKYHCFELTRACVHTRRAPEMTYGEEETGLAAEISPMMMMTSVNTHSSV